MATLDRSGEPIAETGILADVTAEMSEPERDVPCLVLRRESRQLARARIGCVIAQEPQQREKAAFAENRD